MSKRKFFEENLELINDMISQNKPKFEMARILGVKYETLKKYLKEFGIDYNGNQARKGIPHTNERKPIENYLVYGSRITISNLRRRLIRDGLKEEKCEYCGLTEWMGRKIPLELHHKNMDRYDNRLENLEILCSNCHMLAHNYSNTKK